LGTYDWPVGEKEDYRGKIHYHNHGHALTDADFLVVRFGNVVALALCATSLPIHGPLQAVFNTVCTAATNVFLRVNDLSCSVILFTQFSTLWIESLLAATSVRPLRQHAFETLS
jgi:hypothetical protein